MSFSNMSVGIHNICLLIVERVEISLREFIVRRHQFQPQRRIQKAVKEPYEGKGLSADEFY